MPPRFGDRKKTIYRKAYDLERLFGATLEIRIQLGQTVYCYRSAGWNGDSLRQPDELLSSKHIRTENEAEIAASEDATSNTGSGMEDSTENGHPATPILPPLPADNFPRTPESLHQNSIYYISHMEDRKPNPSAHFLPNTPKLLKNVQDLTPPCTDSRRSPTPDKRSLLIGGGEEKIHDDPSPSRLPKHTPSQEENNAYEENFPWTPKELETANLSRKRRRVDPQVKAPADETVKRRLLVPQFVPPLPTLMSPLHSEAK